MEPNYTQLCRDRDADIASLLARQECYCGERDALCLPHSDQRDAKRILGVYGCEGCGCDELPGALDRAGLCRACGTCQDCGQRRLDMVGDRLCEACDAERDAESERRDAEAAWAVEHPELTYSPPSR